MSKTSSPLILLPHFIFVFAVVVVTSPSPCPFHSDLKTPMPLSVLNLICAFSKLLIRTPPNLFNLDFLQVSTIHNWEVFPSPLRPLPHEHSTPTPTPLSTMFSQISSHLKLSKLSLDSPWPPVHLSNIPSIASFQSIGRPLLSPLSMKISSNPPYSHKSLDIFNLPKTLSYPEGPRYLPSFPPISLCTFASLITST